jgi:hypothetical protein
MEMAFPNVAANDGRQSLPNVKPNSSDSRIQGN